VSAAERAFAAASPQAGAPVHVTALLGDAGERRFAGRRRVDVSVAWDEASRRRLRRPAHDGTDVTIDLARGGYLADGAVLHDDGERMLVVARTPERALVVRLDPAATLERLVEQALLLGHAFGNQHVPIDVAGGEVRIPVTTSEQIARATVAALDLDGVSVEVADVALGRERPLPVGHAHGGHAHGDHDRDHAHGDHAHGDHDRDHAHGDHDRDHAHGGHPHEREHAPGDGHAPHAHPPGDAA
jgi:urease accessory protein